MNLADRDDSLRETVAAEVRAHIARQRRSASNVALELGWTQTYLWRRLNGRVSFDLNDLEEIAAVLGVPPTAFFSQGGRLHSKPAAGGLRGALAVAA